MYEFGPVNQTAAAAAAAEVLYWYCIRNERTPVRTEDLNNENDARDHPTNDGRGEELFV